MLYRLNLKNKEYFKILLETGNIIIDYGIKEEFNSIEEYLKKVVSNNYENKRNIGILINSLKRLEKDDFIWVGTNNEYAICKVLEKPEFMKENFPILIRSKPFKVENPLEDVKKSFNKIPMQRILSENTLRKSIDIYEKEYMKENLNENISMEITKLSKALNEKKTKNEIVPYNKKKIKNSKRDFNNINAGELIIELYSREEKKKESNLPVIIEKSEKNKLENLPELYMDVLKGQMNLYLKTQNLILQEFYRVQKMILDNFLDK